MHHATNHLNPNTELILYLAKQPYSSAHGADDPPTFTPMHLPENLPYLMT